MKHFFRANFPFNPKQLPFSYGWVILFASSIGVIASIPGQTMGFSVFTEPLMASLGLGREAISTAYLLGTIGSGLMLPAVGVIYDKVGARILAGTVCLVMAAGLWYLSNVENLAKGLGGGVLVPWISFICITFGFFSLRASGQGALTLVSRGMLGKWFDTKRGFVMSLSGTMVGFSFSAAPYVLDLLIQRFTWQGAWSVLGWMTVGVGIFAWVVFRDNPEECGLRMDGLKPGEESANAKSKNADMIIHREYTRNEAIRTPSFWIFNLALGLQSFAVTAYTFHVISIAEELQVNRTALLQAFMPSSVLGITLSLIAGWINAKIRLKYLLAIMPLGGAVFSMGLLFFPEIRIPLIILGMGMMGGMFGVVSGLVWPRFFGRKHLGAISGINMATMVYASAAAPLYFSLIQRFFGSYEWAFITILVAFLLTVFSSFWADNPQRKAGPLPR